MDLATYTRQLLEQWSYDHPEERVAGLAAVIEAAELSDREKQPFWPTTRFGLVGYTRTGRQIRVSMDNSESETSNAPPKGSNS